MSALPTATPSLDASATDRLRALLLLDGVGTAALGAVALAAAEPLADAVGTPALLRALGVVLVVLGADMLLTRRLTGARLRRAALLLGEVDLLFAAGSTAALAVAGSTAAGTALVLGVAAVCVGMGTGKLLLARALPR